MAGKVPDSFMEVVELRAALGMTNRFRAIGFSDKGGWR